MKYHVVMFIAYYAGPYNKFNTLQVASEPTLATFTDFGDGIPSQLQTSNYYYPDTKTAVIVRPLYCRMFSSFTSAVCP